MNLVFPPKKARVINVYRGTLLFRFEIRDENQIKVDKSQKFKERRPNFFVFLFFCFFVT